MVLGPWQGISGQLAIVLEETVQPFAAFPRNLDIGRVWATRRDLASVGSNDRNPIPLLFQTGYLTIKRVRGDGYELHFPNKEVEIGFAESLTHLYMPSLQDFNGDFSTCKFEDNVLEGNPD